MRIPRIYQAEKLHIGQTIFLDENAARHLGLVLRLSCHDKIILFNGSGEDYLGEILEINDNKNKNKSKFKSILIQIKLHEKISPPTESVLDIHLIQAVSHPEKIEWIIQKAVELGVNHITPVITERCTTKISKPDRWQKIILSACEQSGRTRLPVLHPVCFLSDFYTRPSDPADQQKSQLIFHPGAEKSLGDMIKINPDITHFNLLIGPEGGFSPAEITQAEKKSFISIKLGSRILRTETAPLCAVAAIQTLWGDFR